MKKFDVAGIGNAIVDVVANVDDSFLELNLLEKGSMKLVDEIVSAKICNSINILGKDCGGSAANTIAGLACMGNRAAFIGKVSEDSYGFDFEKSLKEIGVFYNTRKAKDGPPTAHCIVLVTPDAQRTMNTCLGVAGSLCAEDIEEEVIENSSIIYMEGYLWDKPEAKEAIYKGMEIAVASGGKTAFSLSDSFCVLSHREEFMDLVSNQVDILFANEDEINALFKTRSFEEAVEKCRKLDAICALTRSEKGSVIVSGDKVVSVESRAPSKLVDTTGAGDLYAAGFLHGYIKGYSLEASGDAGSIAASEVISHFGARLQKSLTRLLENNKYLTSGKGEYGR
ncbi:MAG: adenosine kinase [Actinomycetia bacterium]|nr:adenosine kinase [Actinomycetes bacterium]